MASQTNHLTAGRDTGGLHQPPAHHGARRSRQNLDIGAACLQRPRGRWSRRLEVRPRYLIAKGGITSSDLATKGLGVKRARVLGQILPGVPVWELGPETKFPGLPYVVFPGNVGGPEALQDAVQKLKT